MVVEMTQFGVENGRMVLGCSMARRKSRVSIELGIQGFESTPRSKFHELPRIESIRLVTEPIRFHPNDPPGKYERWLSSASSGSVELAMTTDRAPVTNAQALASKAFINSHLRQATPSTPKPLALNAQRGDCLVLHQAQNQHSASHA
ncbi:hypothetical protein PIB30_087604 [Stylosanthes scabra]|uniref:Uncharacterized protein n=1 Tax=Stylosanthes scabra TaxID=79078 RepID=A0ABU6YSB3_9FABA|nr:hypothetical protein [Stylosanthes scabra]